MEPQTRKQSPEVRDAESGLLKPVAPDIWIAEGGCVNFYGFPYPTRSVIVRLKSGALWIWSPIALTPKLKSEVDALGSPGFLVSPNKIHHLFLRDWADAYPRATIWGPKSTIKKRKDLQFQAPLTDDPPDGWKHDIDQVWFNGSPVLDEIVFFHRASKTAILADLSENFSKSFLNANWSPWKRCLARVWGIVEGKGYAPLEWRLSFFRRKATRQARDRLLDLNPERVIMAHGVWQPNGGQDYLRTALAWLGGNSP